MQLDEVTPLILTYNEAPNIRACLEGVSWARQVVIVDSGSTDETKSIASAFPNVAIVERKFDNHTNQWNFGLSQVVTRWTLTLDADYRCAHELEGEIVSLPENEVVYLSRFRYCVFGKQLRSSLYPPRAILFQTHACRFRQDGHTQLLDLGSTRTQVLASTIKHDDRKSIWEWFQSQLRYAQLEAKKIALGDDDLTWKDKIRKRLIFAPALTLLYCLFARGLILDGLSGVFYTFQRVFAELALSLALIELKLQRPANQAGQPHDRGAPPLNASREGAHYGGQCNGNVKREKHENTWY